MLSRCRPSSPANRSRRVISSLRVEADVEAGRGFGARDRPRRCSPDPDRPLRGSGLLRTALVAPELAAQGRLAQEPCFERRRISRRTGGAARRGRNWSAPDAPSSIWSISATAGRRRSSASAWRCRPPAPGSRSRVASRDSNRSPSRSARKRRTPKPAIEEIRGPEREREGERRFGGALVAEPPVGCCAPSTSASALRISACTAAGEAVRRGERFEHKRPLLVAERNQRHREALVFGQRDLPARPCAPRPRFVHAS